VALLAGRPFMPPTPRRGEPRARSPAWPAALLLASAALAALVFAAAANSGVHGGLAHVRQTLGHALFAEAEVDEAAVEAGDETVAELLADDEGHEGHETAAGGCSPTATAATADGGGAGSKASSSSSAPPEMSGMASAAAAPTPSYRTRPSPPPAPVAAPPSVPSEGTPNKGPEAPRRPRSVGALKTRVSTSPSPHTSSPSSGSKATNDVSRSGDGRTA
jgi:hypothetical protein